MLEPRELPGGHRSMALDASKGRMQRRRDLDVGDVTHTAGSAPDGDAQLRGELGGSDVGGGSMIHGPNDSTQH